MTGDARSKTPASVWQRRYRDVFVADRKSTRLNSSHGYISYAVFCLKKKQSTSIVRADGARDCGSDRPLHHLPQHINLAAFRSYSTIRVRVRATRAETSAKARTHSR